MDMVRKYDDQKINIKRAFQDWINQRMLDMGDALGRTISVGEYADWLGEERSKVSRWSTGITLPDDGSLLLLASRYDGKLDRRGVLIPDIYSITGTKRPELSIGFLVESMKLRLMDEAMRCDPTMFDELLEKIEDAQRRGKHNATGAQREIKDCA